MQSDPRLRAESIRILPIAASDQESIEPFFVVDASYVAGRDLFRRGMSSLYRRSDGSQLAETVQVHTVRLDKLLEAECLNRTAIALWIDTEGKSFEVITGAADILPVTRMLHVEVETRRVIGEEQRVFDEVVVLLESAGFVLLAADPPLHDFQFNALFLRRDSLHSKSFAVKFWVRALQLRRALSRAALRLVPLRLQRKLLFLTR